MSTTTPRFYRMVFRGCRYSNMAVVNKEEKDFNAAVLHDIDMKSLSFGDRAMGSNSNDTG